MTAPATRPCACRGSPRPPAPCRRSAARPSGRRRRAPCRLVLAGRRWRRLLPFLIRLGTSPSSSRSRLVPRIGPAPVRTITRRELSPRVMPGPARPDLSTRVSPHGLNCSQSTDCWRACVEPSGVSQSPALLRATVTICVTARVALQLAETRRRAAVSLGSGCLLQAESSSHK